MRRLLLTPVLALLVAACSAAPASPATPATPAATFAPVTPAPGGPAELQVYAASSLKKVLVEVARVYEAATPGITLTVSTDSSAALEAKIEQGAPADVFLSAGGYAAGLILQKAIEDAGSLDPAALRAALDKLDLLTFFGGTKFSTDAQTHGKQVAHQMVYVQWQKAADGTLATQVVWPADAKSADGQLRP